MHESTTPWYTYSPETIARSFSLSKSNLDHLFFGKLSLNAMQRKNFHLIQLDKVFSNPDDQGSQPSGDKELSSKVDGIVSFCAQQKLTSSVFDDIKGYLDLLSTVDRVQLLDKGFRKLGAKVSLATPAQATTLSSRFLSFILSFFHVLTHRHIVQHQCRIYCTENIGVQGSVLCRNCRNHILPLLDPEPGRRQSRDAVQMPALLHREPRSLVYQLSGEPREKRFCHVYRNPRRRGNPELVPAVGIPRSPARPGGNDRRGAPSACRLGKEKVAQ